MKLNDMKVYNECPKLEQIARALAHLSAIQRERYEREKASKRQAIRTCRNQSLRAE
jgi:hypothetical protein